MLVDGSVAVKDATCLFCNVTLLSTPPPCSSPLVVIVVCAAAAAAMAGQMAADAVRLVLLKCLATATAVRGVFKTSLRFKQKKGENVFHHHHHITTSSRSSSSHQLAYSSAIRLASAAAAVC